MEGLEAQLAEDLDPLAKRFAARHKPSSSSKELESVLEKERDKLAEVRESRRALEEDASRTRDLLARGVCPTCGQRISGDLSARVEHSEQESKRLEAQFTESSATVSAITAQLADARDYEEEEKEHARALKEKQRVDGEIDLLRKKLKQSNSRLGLKTSELAEANSRAQAMRALSEKIGDLERRLNQARDEDRRASIDLNTARTELEAAKGESDLLTAEVRKKEATREEARRLAGYQGWLSDYFRPTVEMIEEQTLSQAAARFNEHFQRFFTSLVDDPDMVVRVKEDFSPTFEREGFEQDFQALSGGERTSMALAYRFALNTVVKESVSSQPELIILDEPTDGFSKDQVYKMRGLLDALGSRQVILVSHERELESMADHVFRVEKRNGTSVVTGVPS